MATGLEQLKRFVLELELKDGTERRFKFKRTGSRVEASVRRRIAGIKSWIDGEGARQEVRTLVRRLALDPAMTPDDLLFRILDLYEVERRDVMYLDAEVLFRNGVELEAMYRESAWEDIASHPGEQR